MGELFDEIVQLLAVVAHTGHKGVDVSALLLAGDLREKSILRRKGTEIVLVKKGIRSDVAAGTNGKAELKRQLPCIRSRHRETYPFISVLSKAMPVICTLTTVLSPVMSSTLTATWSCTFLATTVTP